MSKSPKIAKSKMRNVLNAQQRQQQAQQQVREPCKKDIEEFYKYQQDKVNNFPEILTPNHQKDLKTVCSKYWSEIKEKEIFENLKNKTTTIDNISKLLSKLKDSSISFIEKQHKLNIIDKNTYKKEYNVITEKYKSSAKDINTLKENIQTTIDRFNLFSTYCNSFSHSTKIVYCLISEIDALHYSCYKDYDKINNNDCDKLYNEYSKMYKQTIYNLYELNNFHYAFIAQRRYNQVPEIHKAEVLREKCEDFKQKCKDCKRDLRKKKQLEQHQKWLDQQLEKQIEKLEKEEEPQPMENHNTDNINQNAQRITLDNLRQQNQNPDSIKKPDSIKEIEKSNIIRKSKYEYEYSTNANNETIHDYYYINETNLLANSKPVTQEHLETLHKLSQSSKSLDFYEQPKILNDFFQPTEPLNFVELEHINNISINNFLQNNVPENIFELSNYMNYMNIK